MIKLTSEQLAAALHPDGLHCEVDGQPNSFVILNADTHRKLKKAFYDQNVIKSAQTGFEDCQNGRSLPLAEADEVMRKRISAT